MSLDFLLLAASIGTAAVLRWVALSSGGSGAEIPQAQPEPAPAPAVDARLPAAWADPSRKWPALDAENELLATRLPGRMSTHEYQVSLTQLARRCDPAHAGEARTEHGTAAETDLGAGGATAA